MYRRREIISDNEATPERIRDIFGLRHYSVGLLINLQEISGRYNRYEWAMARIRQIVKNNYNEGNDGILAIDRILKNMEE